MSIKTIKLEPEKCIGCNTCLLLDPDTFEIDNEKMIATVKSTATITEKTTTAIASCPVGAITIIEE